MGNIFIPLKGNTAEVINLSGIMSPLEKQSFSKLCSHSNTILRNKYLKCKEIMNE